MATKDVWWNKLKEEFPLAMNTFEKLYEDDPSYDRLVYLTVREKSLPEPVFESCLHFSYRKSYSSLDRKRFHFLFMQIKSTDDYNQKNVFFHLSSSMTQF